MFRVRSIQRPIYRVPASKYWAQYWYPRSVGTIATIQLIMTFGVVSMEIGNTVIDIFRSNVFAGYWAFPFMLGATIATYACVCSKQTETKAIIALVLQIISMAIVIIMMGFLMAFIATGFALCLGLQCLENSSTSFSNSTYSALKQGFISTEFVCSTIYIALAILYIVLFVKCYQKIPRIPRLIRPVPLQHTLGTRQSSILSASTNTYYRSNTMDSIRSQTSSRAEKVCPNCKHISPYIPQENLVQCPKCKYQSPLVEHAQQWSS